MDEILDDRYTILIANYPVDNRVLAELRKEILENLHGGRRLRSDAALVLISLFDQMIIRPYHGPARSPYFYADRFSWSDDGAFPLPKKFREMHDEKFLELCIASLRKIISGAKNEGKDESISSHSIIRSIEANWTFLSEMYGWG